MPVGVQHTNTKMRRSEMGERRTIIWFKDGRGGIRTLEGGYPPYLLSREALSTSQPLFQAS